MSTRLSTRDSGTALNSDGSNNYQVQIVDNTKLQFATTGFSMSFWAKRNELTGTTKRLIYKRNGTNGFLVQLRSDGDYEMNVGNGVSLLAKAFTSLQGKSSKWNFFTVTHDLTTYKIYLNGIFVTSQALTGFTDSGTNLFFFNDGPTGTNGTNAKLDEVRLWNYALSATEVSNLYFNNIVPRTGLVGEWLFNEGSGTTALDSSGNNNNGTITGATYTTDVPFKPRVASSNKVAVKDMNASLNFSATTDKVDCGTDFIGTGDVTVSGWVNPKQLGFTSGGRILDNGKFQLNLNQLHNALRISSDASIAKYSSDFSLPKNKWTFFTVTRNSVGLSSFRINAVASGTQNETTGTPTTATSNTFLGNFAAATGGVGSNLKDIKVFNRILTTTEQDNLMSGINPTDYATSIVRDFSLNEGAGTTVYSKNNTALTGTITGATWSSDTPSKKRNQVGGNLVKNGDLSYVPVVNVASTASAKWYDGTLAGSATNDLFNWYCIIGVGITTFTVDTSTKSPLGNNSLKIDCDATGRGRFCNTPFEATTTKDLVNKYGIPVLPNTSYTFSYYMKTLNSLGSRIDRFVYDNDGVQITGTLPTAITGTTDWTLYTFTFTTGATTRFFGFRALIVTAGNPQTTWFANITLTPTVNTTRISV